MKTMSTARTFGTNTAALLCALFLCTVALTGCQKEEDAEEEVDPTTNAGQVSITDGSIVKMNVNGTTITLQVGGGIAEIFDSGISGGPPPDTSAAVYLAGFKNGTDTLFALRMGTLHFLGSVPSTAEFQDFFAPGTRVLDEPDFGADGVSMQWWNSNGEWFGTSCGVGGESGSFGITHIAHQQIGQEFFTKIRAVFSGTFRSCDGLNGDQTITDGVLVLRFKNQP